MFVIAMDHTIAYGVGGMVLFASEVGLSLRSSFKHLTIPNSMEFSWPAS